MSKPTKTTATPLVTFTLQRFEGGWVVIQVTTKSDVVVSVARITEPDMLPIAQSKMITAIRETTP